MEQQEADLVKTLYKVTASPLLRRLLRLYQDGELDSLRFADAFRQYRFAPYVGPILASRATAPFLTDPAFDRVYRESMDETYPGHVADIRWKLYLAVELARTALARGGAFVECGTNRGITPLMVLRLAPECNVPFWLFDTFEGVVREQQTDRERENEAAGEFEPCFDLVAATFRPYPTVRLVKGVVPESLAEYDDGSVSFLHIDMNVAYPEVETLRFFWPKMARGGVVLFDDYACPKHDVQQNALDACAAEFDRTITSLPTGQGALFV